MNSTTHTYSLIMRQCVVLFLIIINSSQLYSQETPQIISQKEVYSQNFLPDFSYAGYHFGNTSLPEIKEKVILATDFGVKANDNLDDSKALLKAFKAAHEVTGNVVLQLPAGKIILSDILYIERSNFVLRGAGSGKEGTEIFCPRPMMYLKEQESLAELREYLTSTGKRQVEKENNIDLPFSQYAWSGGFIWTQVPKQRVKSYMEKYDTPPTVLAKVIQGKRGEKEFIVSDVNGLKVGDVVELDLFNKEGEKAEIIEALYRNSKTKIGNSHWRQPNLALVRQQVEIVSISKNKITIKTPLLLDVKPNYQALLIEWKHLSEVGIEHLRISFPDAARVAHHVEQGYNAIFLTRIFNSWVKDVTINNAESGILTEEIANVTIRDIVTEGKNIAHYTVAMGGVHNVLVENLKVYNKAVHPLSFNTFSTKNVYENCEVFIDPDLDQHAGANHQNLFDNIKVHFEANADNKYPLFEGGGAGYWKPSHGAYSTFWNINVEVTGGDSIAPIELNGMDEGPFARIIGINGNRNFTVKYGPDAYIEFINKPMANIPSLYGYQLKKRLK
ncbi:MAG: hypothetical protein NT048_06735 [Flavobacterium sp.]|nr:hypothetical protein [Flavobacterium sp.]